MKTLNLICLIMFILLCKHGQSQLKEELVNATLYDEIINEIQNSEYSITYDDQIKKFQAPNRLNNFRSTFSELGVSIRPRIKVGSDWYIEFHPQYLYKEELNKVALKKSNVTKNYSNTIELKSNYFFTSQYINKQEGLKSNFIISKKIDGNDPLVLSIRINTNLDYYLEDNKIKFIDDNQIIQMQYQDLFVFDANGYEIASTFQLDKSNNSILIVVEDHDAVYPITIDPLSITPAWSAEPNSVDAYFGFALEGAGDVNADGFDDVVIGAHQYDNGSTDEGRAFLYLGTSLGLSTTYAWSAESNQASSYFGYCVRGAGDVNNDGFDDVIISAHYYDNGSTDEGRVYLYLGDATGLQTTASWTAEANQSGARFGSNMDGGGDVNNDGYDDILISAPYYDFTATDEGRAYLYLGTASGLSTTPVWNYYGNQISALLHSVAFIGDVNNDGLIDIGTGAYQYDNGSIDEGVVNVFYNIGAGFGLTPSWTFELNKASSKLGGSISDAGDINGDGFDDFLAGAYEYDLTSFDNHGKCLLFYGSATGLAASPNWQYDGDYDDGRLGAIVSGVGDINGDNFDDFITSQPYFDDGTSGFAHKGRLLLFYGSPSGPSSTFNWQFTGSTSGAEATNGYGAGFIGDVNNDGYNEIMIGSYSYSGGSTDEGRAQLFYGSSIYPEVNPFSSITGSTSTSTFGSVIKTLKDVNNDGYPDLCVAAPFFDNGSVDEGKVFGYWGNGTGFSATPNWTAEGNQDNANFGFSMDGLDDINNDGFSDLLIGAPGFDVSLSDQGRVFIYKGTSTGLYYLPSKIYNGSQAGAKLGYQVATASDINSDGLEDFLLNAPYYDDVISNRGIVYLYKGILSGYPSTPSKSILGSQADAMFGSVLSNVGDINNDGYNDVIISSPLYDNLYSNSGMVQVYKGGESIDDFSVATTFEGNQATAQLGYSIAGKGDVNGDGINDFMIGAPFYDLGQTDNGAIYLYFGGATFPTTPNWISTGPTYNTQLGNALNINGDYNGDGYSDIAATGLNDEINLVDEGLVNIYFGSFLGPRNFPSIAFSCNQPLSKFGTSITSIDINNDELSDFIIGAPNYDAVFVDGGAVFIFMGVADSCDLLTDVTMIEDTSEITIICETIGEPEFVNYRYRLLGDSLWNYGYSFENTFDIISLESCSIYEIGIQTACLSGSGEWFELLANTIGCIEDCSVVEITDVNVVGLTEDTIIVNWTLMPDIINYTVSYKKIGLPTWIEVNVTGNSTIIAGLDSCSTYEFTVKADCEIDGPVSDIITYITSVCAEPCETAPTGLYADAITSSSANIHWNPVFGATQYKVYYRPIGGAWTNLNSITNSKNLVGLLPLTTYQCKVRANCPGIASPFTSPITFTTPAKTGGSDSNVELYPNPSTGSFTMYLNTNTMDDQFFVIITNLQGEQVYSEFYNNGGTTIDFELNLAPGIYQLEYMSNFNSGVINLIVIK